MKSRCLYVLSFLSAFRICTLDCIRKIALIFARYALYSIYRVESIHRIPCAMYMLLRFKFGITDLTIYSFFIPYSMISHDFQCDHRKNQSCFGTILQLGMYKKDEWSCLWYCYKWLSYWYCFKIIQVYYKIIFIIIFKFVYNTVISLFTAIEHY